MSPRSRSHQSAFVSVGVKLASAIVLIVAMVGAMVFVVLSHYAKRSMLESKEAAAMGVARLFGDSLSASLVFGDEAGIEEALANLSHDGDVVYAAVYAADAESTTGHGPALAELTREATGIRPPASTTAGARAETMAGWVVVEAGVTDPAGEVVGVAQAAFSLARENEAILAIERRVLWFSAALAIGLSLVLVFLARRILVRPLARLVDAAKALERGEKAIIPVTANDEIGHVASAFQAMSAAIENREHRLGARNREMRLVLDNVEEGFLTIDPTGTMNDERSRILDDWFSPADDDSFAAYLARIDEGLGEWFRLAWDAVVEGSLPLELNVEQLPSAFTHRGRHFALRYRPILEGETLVQMLVVIRNVTERVERERAESTQRETATIFRHLMADRSGFEDFFVEARALVGAVERTTNDDVALRRLLHTLKGNCALYRLDRIATACHELESRMAEGDGLPVEGRARLRALWSEIEGVCGDLGGSTGARRIEIDEEEHETFLQAIQAGLEPRRLSALASSWRLEPATRCLERVAGQARHLASRMGLAPLRVACRATALRLPARKWAPFWSTFTHVVRNAIDHGIEPAAEREAAGKPASGQLTLAVEVSGDEVVVSIADDGRGIAWNELAVKALSRGLPRATKADLLEALFADGVSSRDEVTETSGRGVGLSAVRVAVRGLGGRVEVETEAGRGTTFRFVLPGSMLREAVMPISLAPPRQESRVS